MRHDNNEKRKITNGRERATKSIKKKSERLEKKLQILGHIGSGHHQIFGIERKKLKKNTSAE